PMTSAQVAPDALVTQALATGPYRLPATTTLTPGTTHVLDERSAIVSAYDSPDMEGPRGLILAPHSTLVFQGTALISTYANADIGVFGSNDSRLSQPYTHEVSSTAQIHIGFRSEPGFGQDLGTPWHAESSSVDVLTSPGGGALSTESPVSRREFKPFEFTLTNDSDQALPAYFNWYLTSTTKASVTTAVPEPGTWALLVAGLALAPVMRRGKKTLR
ncbi:MAG: PEP-CTERM sorting domain-containing protein, partial [Rubrivivax sp.]